MRPSVLFDWGERRTYSIIAQLHARVKLDDVIPPNQCPDTHTELVVHWPVCRGGDLVPCVCLRAIYV